MYSVAVRVDLEDFFCQEWLQTLSGLREHRNSMLVNLSGTDNVICILAYSFLCCDSYCAVQKGGLTFEERIDFQWQSLCVTTGCTYKG